MYLEFLQGLLEIIVSNGDQFDGHKVCIAFVLEVLGPELPSLVVFAQDHPRGGGINLQLLRDLGQVLTLRTYRLYEQLSFLNRVSDTLKEILEYFRFEGTSI